MNQEEINAHGVQGHRPIPPAFWKPLQELVEQRERKQITARALRHQIIELGWHHGLSEQNLIDAAILKAKPTQADTAAARGGGAAATHANARQEAPHDPATCRTCKLFEREEKGK